MIGEEIYDEFDPQGAHGDPYVPPARPESAPAPTAALLTDKPPAAEGSGVTRTTPVLKPIALKGLNFLRSRSAPPTPRDITDTIPPNLTGDHGRIPTPTTTAINRANSQLAIDDPTLKIEQDTEWDNTLPAVVLEQYTPSSDLPPVTSSEDDSSEVKKTSPSPTFSVPVAHVVVPSRSASPAPSLEAILFDRKRRLAAGTQAPGTPVGSVVMPVASTASLTVPPVTVPGVIGAIAVPRTGPGSVKGTRFKSSPLGGGDRAGVVAEKVKENMIGASVSGGKVGDVENKPAGAEEVRIPEEKDKESPDNDSEDGGEK